MKKSCHTFEKYRKSLICVDNTQRKGHFILSIWHFVCLTSLKKYWQGKKNRIWVSELLETNNFFVGLTYDFRWCNFSLMVLDLWQCHIKKGGGSLFEQPSRDFMCCMCIVGQNDGKLMSKKKNKMGGVFWCLGHAIPTKLFCASRWKVAYCNVCLYKCV